MSNTEKTFTAGQRVYSLRGEQGRYVAPAKESSGHIVEAIYIDEDDPEAEEPSYAGEVVCWRQVFAKPPVALLDDEMRLKSDQLAQLRVEANALAMQKINAERDMKAVKDSLKTHEALEYIDDILAGRITHYVVVDNDREAYVWSHEQAIEKKPDWFTDRSGDRMLTLRLNSWSATKGGAGWVMCGRDDRSRHVWPFNNEAAAIAKCRDVVASMLNEMAQPAHYFNAWVFERLAASAKACGVEVPAALAERKAREELSAAQADAQKAQRELDVARVRIAKAQEAFPQAPTAEPAPPAEA